MYWFVGQSGHHYLCCKQQKREGAFGSDVAFTSAETAGALLKQVGDDPRAHSGLQLM
jgi:hypothetical protein